ncbi:hypothetical protein IQ266_22650 [filamentous cyanobacterium LEGE 11480]|uniref:Uncharacterized protein n=1 Tax=Romeriopsis navalis LEGE 11480 TaxID=2777977 RepID=A0A928VRP7_9CYAN|nr:hypothetical protein [Romeriopsis navalis]MBE9032543.1 hypothetical protein [Romeriopsis navalis LEGE 11480]
MATTIELKAGEKLTIFRRNFSSVPVEYRFEASSLDGSEPSGAIEICGSNWIFPKPPLVQPLQTINVAQAGMWDTFFRVDVTAHEAVILMLPKRRGQIDQRVILLAVVALVIILALVIFLVTQ